MNEEGKIQFTWQDNLVTGTAKASDKNVAVIYFPNQKQDFFSVGVAKRSEGIVALFLGKMQGEVGESRMSLLSGIKRMQQIVLLQHRWRTTIIMKKINEEELFRFAREEI